MSLRKLKSLLMNNEMRQTELAAELERPDTTPDFVRIRLAAAQKQYDKEARRAERKAAKTNEYVARDART